MYMNALIAAAILGYAAAAPTNAAESLDLQARDAEAIVLRPGMHPIPVPKLPNGMPRFSIKVAERDAEPEAFRLLPGEHPIETPELPNGLHFSMKNKLPRDAEAADEALINRRPLGHGPVVLPGHGPALPHRGPGRLPLGHGPVVLPNHPTVHPLENRDADADAADEAQVNRFRGHGPVVHPGIGPAVPLRGPGRLPHGHGPVVHPLENRDAAAPAAPSKPNKLFPKLKGTPRRFCDGCSVQMFQEKHFENQPLNQVIAQRDVEDDVEVRDVEEQELETREFDEELEARDAEEELEAREAIVKAPTNPTNPTKPSKFNPFPKNRFPHKKPCDGCVQRPPNPFIDNPELFNELHTPPMAEANGQQAQPKARDADEELETRDAEEELEAREPIIMTPAGSGEGNPYIPSPLNRFPRPTHPLHPLHNIPIAGAQPKARDVDEELETRDVDTELEAREPIVQHPAQPQPKKPFNLNNYLRNQHNRPCDGCVHTMYTDNPGLFNQLHNEPIAEAKGQPKARDVDADAELAARDDSVAAANAQLADFVAGHV